MIMLMQPRSNIHLKVLVVFVQFGSGPRAERWGKNINQYFWSGFSENIYIK